MRRLIVASFARRSLERKLILCVVRCNTDGSRLGVAPRGPEAVRSAHHASQTEPHEGHMQNPLRSGDAVALLGQYRDVLEPWEFDTLDAIAQHYPSPYPRRDRLAAMLDVSERTVDRRLAALGKSGLLGSKRVLPATATDAHSALDVDSRRFQRLTTRASGLASYGLHRLTTRVHQSPCGCAPGLAAATV